MPDIKHSDKDDVSYSDATRFVVLTNAGALRNMTRTELEAQFPGGGGTGAKPNKSPVRMAATGNLTLSGEQTIDTIVGTTGDRVLAPFQTDETENGIYVMDSGAWARSTDANEGSELESAVVLVSEGAVNEGKVFQQLSTNITLGVTDIVWIESVTTFDGHDEAPLGG